MCARWIPIERVEDVILAPGEPTPELGGVQRVGVAGVASEVRHGSELSGCHRVGLEGQQRGHRCHLASRLSPAPVAVEVARYLPDAMAHQAHRPTRGSRWTRELGSTLDGPRVERQLVDVRFALTDAATRLSVSGRSGVTQDGPCFLWPHALT